MSNYLGSLSLPGLVRPAVGVQRSLRGDLQAEVRARVGLDEAVAAIWDYERAMSSGKVRLTPVADCDEAP